MRRALLFAGLTIIVILAAAAVAEILLSHYAPLPDPFPRRATWRYNRFLPSWNVWGEPPRVWEWDPGPLNGVTPGLRRVELNRYGFLYNEARLARRDPREVRIAVVGGSTVECVALMPEARWPARLEQTLRRRLPGREVTVLNLGITGQGTWTHLATVAQHIVHIDVDWVVFLLGANELSRSSAHYVRLLDANSFGELTPLEGPRLLLTRLQLGRWFRLGYKRLLRRKVEPYFAETRDVNATLPALPIEPKLSRAALDDYDVDIVSLGSLVQAHGIRPLFLTQPMLWHEGMSAQEEQLCWMLRYEYQNKLYRPTPQAAAALMETSNAELLRVCRERRYPVLDLAAIIPRSRSVFYDDVHFNDPGAVLVAEYVADLLLAQGLAILSADNGRKGYFTFVPRQ